MNELMNQKHHTIITVNVSQSNISPLHSKDVSCCAVIKEIDDKKVCFSITLFSQLSHLDLYEHLKRKQTIQQVRK
jgi:uncharacterized protein (DUF1810 family)